jgi:N-acyl-D-aspartate/D-glutamate deacylase
LAPTECLCDVGGLNPSPQELTMLDCIIKNGILVDGSGTPRKQADVGIRDGRFAAIGKIADSAKQTIDADGLIVAPGFIDIHTHFDAQAFWDPALTPSSLHGVTTVVGGNCGFSIAPLTEDAGPYLMRMLSRVEGMPLEALEAGVPWNWRTFAEYLARLEGRLAINAGFLVGHSALRRVVMGEDAVGNEASPKQIEQMVRLLHESIEAGGLGFSSSQAPTHNDGAGKPVPSRWASREEMLALAGAIRDHQGTSLEFIPTVGLFNDDHKELMASMSRAADRALNWNVLNVVGAAPDIYRSQLTASDYAREHGGKVVALTLPQPMALRLNLISGFVLDALPGWAEVVTLPLPQRKQAFADPAVRRKLDAGANSDEAGVFRFFGWWANYTVDETFTPENARFRGRTLGEIAAELDKSPFDAMIDLALSEDLRTSFMPSIPGTDDETWKLRAEVWRDPRALIGASDAGAHLDMIDTFTLSTTLLGTAVRQRGLLSLEEAVSHLADRPARFYGIRERGRIAAGWHADVVIFDDARVGPGPIHTRSDLPAGAARLFAEAEGIEHVLVNGTEIVRGKACTGSLPGTVMRSGRDTETVPLNGDR